MARMRTEDRLKCASAVFSGLNEMNRHEHQTAISVPPAGCSFMLKSRVCKHFRFADLENADEDLKNRDPIDYRPSDDCSIFIVPVKMPNEGYSMQQLRQVLQDEAACLDSRAQQRLWRIRIDAATILTKLVQLQFRIASCCVDDGVHTWTIVGVDAIKDLTGREDDSSKVEKCRVAPQKGVAADSLNSSARAKRSFNSVAKEQNVSWNFTGNDPEDANAVFDFDASPAEHTADDEADVVGASVPKRGKRVNEGSRVLKNQAESTKLASSHAVTLQNTPLKKSNGIAALPIKTPDVAKRHVTFDDKDDCSGDEMVGMQPITKIESSTEDGRLQRRMRRMKSQAADNSDEEYVAPLSSVLQPRLRSSSNRSLVVAGNISSKMNITKALDCTKLARITGDMRHKTDIRAEFRQESPPEAVGNADTFFYAVVKISISTTRLIAIADNCVSEYLTRDGHAVQMAALAEDLTQHYYMPKTFIYTNDAVSFPCIVAEQIDTTDRWNAVTRLDTLFKQMQGKVKDSGGPLCARVQYVRTIMFQQYRLTDPSLEPDENGSGGDPNINEWTSALTEPVYSRNRHYKVGKRTFELEVPDYSPDSEMAKLHGNALAYRSNTPGRVIISRDLSISVNALQLMGYLRNARRQAIQAPSAVNDSKKSTSILSTLLYHVFRLLMPTHKLITLRWSTDKKDNSIALPISQDEKDLIYGTFQVLKDNVNDYVDEINRRRPKSEQFSGPLEMSMSAVNNKVIKFIHDMRAKAFKRQDLRDLTVSANELAEGELLVAKYPELAKYTGAMPLKALVAVLDASDELLQMPPMR